MTLECKKKYEEVCTSPHTPYLQRRDMPQAEYIHILVEVYPVCL